ncbi:hypothetical protein CYMTET_6082 [Cymbomonas tetramitiformis]|uniref:Uncharacterized protein n=1 Tax=Cymbomonas tetramitiformis TaxID=36881 RepID=A0AAE0GXU2_9CHLO|nr:hypothetical protein CYMTET_6082 [Cymbomonas tetramitiformis]
MCKESLDPEPSQPVFQSFYGANDIRIWKVRVDRLSVLVQAGMLKRRSYQLEQELIQEAKIDMTAVTRGAHQMMASAEHSMAQYQTEHAASADVLANYTSPLATPEFDIAYVPRFLPDGSPNSQFKTGELPQLTYKVSELSVSETPVTVQFDEQVELQRTIRDLENVNKSLSEKMTKLEHDFGLKSQAFDEAKAHAAHLKGLLAQRDVEKADMTDLIVSYDPTYGQTDAVEPVLVESAKLHVRFDSESESQGEDLSGFDSQLSGSASEYTAEDPNDELSF